MGPLIFHAHFFRYFHFFIFIFFLVFVWCFERERDEEEGGEREFPVKYDP